MITALRRTSGSRPRLILCRHYVAEVAVDEADSPNFRDEPFIFGRLSYSFGAPDQSTLGCAVCIWSDNVLAFEFTVASGEAAAVISWGSATPKLLTSFATLKFHANKLLALLRVFHRLAGLSGEP